MFCSDPLDAVRNLRFDLGDASLGFVALGGELLTLQIERRQIPAIHGETRVLLRELRASSGRF